jgi:hypothetical protein
LAVLDRVRIGIVIIEPGGCVIATNDEAQRLLQMGEGVALARNDHLVCRDDDLTRSLDEAIHKASSTALGKHETPETLMAIPRRSGARPLLLEIIPLRDSKAEMERDFGGAMVAIIDPDKPRLFDASILGKAYRLSKAERDDRAAAGRLWHLRPGVLFREAERARDRHPHRHRRRTR